MFLFSTLSLFVSPVSASWSIDDYWTSDVYDEKCLITIYHDYIDENLTDFPVLIKLGSSVVSMCAVDFCFTNLASSVLYDYEVDVWDSDESLVWVKIPFVSKDFNTYFWFYYDASFDIYINNASAVWDSNFVMVQHMDDDPDNATITGSTDFGHVGTKNSANEPLEINNGKIYKAQQFDGLVTDIQIPSDAELMINTSFMVSLWAKRDAGSIDSHGTMLTKAYSFSTRNYNLFWANNGNIIFRLHDVTNGVDKSTILYGFTALHVWHYIVGIYDGVNMTLYVDGVVSIPTAVVGTVATSTSNVQVGRMGYNAGLNNYRFNGIIDEVHISNISRSPAWVNASYDNVVNYDSFMYVAVGDLGGDDIIVIDTNQFIIGIQIILFILFIWIGYSIPAMEGDKKTFHYMPFSGGMFIIFSAIDFISLSISLNTYELGMITGYLTTVGIILLLVGILKAFYYQ